MPSLKNSNDDDLVSVIIPTYNRASLIEGAIQSALDQSHPNVEIIVVNDGSTDNTSTILANLPGIQIIHQENQGQGAARQRGLEQSKGNYIASLDSDDIWQPDFLSNSLQAIQQTQAAFVFSAWSTQTPAGKPLVETSLGDRAYLCNESHEPVGNWRLLSVESTRRVFTHHYPAPSSSLLVNRKFISKGWHSHLSMIDDWAFILEIILKHSGHGVTCAYSPSKLWTKQIDGSNICDRHTNPIQLFKQYIDDRRKLMITFGDQFTAHEKKNLQHEITIHFSELAYCQSVTPGTRREAIHNALNALSSNFNLFHCTLLAKCLLRSGFGLCK